MAGSSKLDMAMSVDIASVTSGQDFLQVMQASHMKLLNGLESWVGQQKSGLEVAGNVESLANFDKLKTVGWWMGCTHTVAPVLGCSGS